MGGGGSRNAEAGVDEKPAIDVWGFFHPSLFEDLTHMLCVDDLCLVKGETERTFPDSRKAYFGSSLNSKMGMSTQVVNYA